LILNDDATAAEFKTGVKGYYAAVWKTDIDVTMKWLDVNGVATNVVLDQVERCYTIELKKLIGQMSSQTMTATRDNSSAAINFDMPGDAIPGEVQLSKPPLSGHIFIRCVQPDNTFSDTREFWYTDKQESIAAFINEDCYGMNDKAVVKTDKFAGYQENGIDIMIHFYGLNSKPGQYQIKSAVVKDPFTGDKQSGVQTAGSVMTSASNNIYYPSIPFEMLRTKETMPQVQLTVGGVPAACHGLNCDYNYIAATGSITAFTFNTGSNLITITGNALPAQTEIEDITFADSKCKIGSATAQQITCTLVRVPTMGNWVATIKTFKGKFPSTASPQAVAGSITQVNNLDTINVLGGNIIKFTGVGFAHQIKG